MNTPDLEGITGGKMDLAVKNKAYDIILDLLSEWSSYPHTIIEISNYIVTSLKKLEEISEVEIEESNTDNWIRLLIDILYSDNSKGKYLIPYKKKNKDVGDFQCPDHGPHPGRYVTRENCKRGNCPLQDDCWGL